MENRPVADQLASWARDTYGDGATVADVRAMPGHSGYSFGFTLVTPEGREGLVVRLPPPGSKRRGNADVLRQARVMTAMADAGVPVPQLRHSGDGERWFGSPSYVVTLVPGRSTSVYTEVEGSTEDGTGMEPVFRSAMETLAAIHQVDWRQALDGWADPVDLGTEVDRWLPTLAKSSDEGWVRQGMRVAGLLHESRPADPPPTVVHGDYYSNNWIFLDGRITAVVDWEIAGIGAPTIDVGWVSMLYDDECWGPLRNRWSVWTPTTEFLVEAYAAAGGPDVRHLDWYRALAGYRLGCITARHYDLHRSGKHRDDAWEVNAEAFPLQMGQAERLLTIGAA